MHFASLIGLFKSTDSIVILNIVDDLCFKQFLDLFKSIKSGVIKLSISIPIIPFFFFDESKSRDPEIGIFLRQLSPQKELDPTPEPSGNLALSVIWCSISLFTCLDLFCYLICKLLANYRSFIQKNRSGLFLTAYFLFWEILNWRLPFAVCRKRES